VNSAKTVALLRLSDSDLVLAEPVLDVRGRMVIGAGGEEVGEVASIFVDENERRARLLEVESGGFLGFGGKVRLIPTESVVDVREGEVHIDQTRQRVHESPAYDPELTEGRGWDDQAYFGALYSHYDIPAYWAAGYVPRPRGSRDPR
jgi:sporulation protein YlmC with PRC-barrel domain